MTYLKLILIWIKSSEPWLRYNASIVKSDKCQDDGYKWVLHIQLWWLHRLSDTMGVICEHLHLQKQGNVNVKSIHQCTLNVLSLLYVYRGNNDDLFINSTDHLLMLCKCRFTLFAMYNFMDYCNCAMLIFYCMIFNYLFLVIS